MNAREEILERVRRAIAPASATRGPAAGPAGSAPPGPAGSTPPGPAGSTAPAKDGLERRYRTQTDDGLDTFLDRLHHYGARTWQTGEAELDATVPTILAELGARRVVAPDGIPDGWLEQVEALRDSPPLSPHDLDRSDCVLSTCAVAIAQTGTIVLDGGPGMGRRILSLVPDRLLCVVRAEQIVGSVPEAIARLDPGAPLTFISGPSATVDIEMVRVAGVHGPRELAVVVASDDHKH